MALKPLQSINPDKSQTINISDKSTSKSDSDSDGISDLEKSEAILQDLHRSYTQTQQEIANLKQAYTKLTQSSTPALPKPTYEPLPINPLSIVPISMVVDIPLPQHVLALEFMEGYLFSEATHRMKIDSETILKPDSELILEATIDLASDLETLIPKPI